MKRNDVVKLLCPILNSDTSPTVKAELILKQLDELCLLKPNHKKEITRMCIMGTPYQDTIEVEGWEE